VCEYNGIVTDVNVVKLDRAQASRRALDLAVPSTPANSFITDICILFVREQGDWLATARWVSLLTTLGIPPSNARTALHRMTKAGYLERRPANGRPGYAISSAWIDWIEGIEDEPTDDDGSDGWTLLNFSIPETQRAERHAMRTLLGRLGFASLGNGVWIASARRQPDARVALQTSGFADYVDLFRAEYDGFVDVPEFARRCWDIEEVADAYRTFIRDLRRRLKHRLGADARTFVDVVCTNNAWRRINFADPALPSSALPSGWPRPEAKNLRDELLRRFLEPAREYVSSLDNFIN
jgi:phenylacetic acid degradation operon negative regulatory protein